MLTERQRERERERERERGRAPLANAPPLVYSAGFGGGPGVAQPSLLPLLPLLRLAGRFSLLPEREVGGVIL